MTDENFEKIFLEGIVNPVQKLLARNEFTYPSHSFEFLIPFMVTRRMTFDKNWFQSEKGNRVEVLTLIPIYNFKKDGGERVWDYRGTLIYNDLDDVFGTQFVRQFTSITQIFDFFEESKW